MADYPDILKREHLTNEERKCICNQLMTISVRSGSAR